MSTPTTPTTSPTTQTDIVKFLNTPINAVEKNPMQEHVDPLNNNPKQNLREAAEKVYEVNALEGTGPYKAIVLKIELQPTEPDPASWGAHISKIFGNDPGLNPPRVRIRARIPSLHAGVVPVPTGLDGPNADHFAIDAHPLFEAMSTAVPPPQKVGDIVWVDFGNRESLEDPIYIRPMIEPIPPGGVGGPCGGGIAGGGGSFLNAAGPAGDLKTHENMPIGHIGPKLKIRYGAGRPKKGEKPKGKGIFIDRYPTIPKGFNPDSLAKKCEWAGLGHVIFQCIAQAKSTKIQNGKVWYYSPEKMKPYVDALMNRGIQVFVWGWPYMGCEVRGWNKNNPSEKGFCDFIVDFAAKVGAVGVVTDPEADYQWSKKQHKAQGWNGTGLSHFTKEQVERAAALHAKKLVSLAHAKGLSAGFTSYTMPSYHKTFPWTSFVSGKFDFAICQTYGTYPSAASYWERAVKAYEKIGFTNVIGALGNYGKPWDGSTITKWGKTWGGPAFDYGYGAPQKPPARMRFEASVHPYRNDAATYWAWRHGKLHKDSWPESRWDMIRKLGNPNVKDELKGKATPASGSATPKPVAAPGTAPVSGSTPHATKQKAPPAPPTPTSPSKGVAVTDGKGENPQTNDAAGIKAKIDTLEAEKVKLQDHQKTLHSVKNKSQIEKLDKWIEEKDTKIDKLYTQLSATGGAGKTLADARKKAVEQEKMYNVVKKKHEETSASDGVDAATTKTVRDSLKKHADALSTARKEYGKALEAFKSNPNGPGSAQGPTSFAGTGGGGGGNCAGGGGWGGGGGGAWNVGDIKFDTASIRSQKVCNKKRKKEQIEAGSKQWWDKSHPTEWEAFSKGDKYRYKTFGLTEQRHASGFNAVKKYWKNGGRGLAKRGKLGVNDAGSSNQLVRHLHELGKAIEDKMCRPYKLGGGGVGPHGIQCSSFTRTVRMIALFGLYEGNLNKDDYKRITRGRIMDGVKRSGSGPKGSSSGLDGYEIPGIGGSNSQGPVINKQKCFPWNGTNLMPGDCIMTGRFLKRHSASFATWRPCYISHILIAYVGDDGNIWIAESGGPFAGVGTTPVNEKKARWAKYKKMIEGGPGAPAVYVYQPFEFTSSWQSVGGRPSGEWSPALWNKIKSMR